MSGHDACERSNTITRADAGVHELRVESNQNGLNSVKEQIAKLNRIRCLQRLGNLRGRSGCNRET
jgi:hypothetical protein